MSNKKKLGFLSLSENGIYVSFNADEISAFENAKKQFSGYKPKKISKQSFRSSLGDRREIPEEIAEAINDNYALVPFRMLSATTVGSGGWQSTTFNEDVLQRGMSKLINKPVYRDHYMTPDYWLGIVETVTFTQESFQDGGIRVPAGIDALLRLSTTNEMNRSLVEGIENRSVNSNSVGIYFEWEMSHEFEDEWDFYYFLGEMIDGREVTRVVTNIVDFAETSIVGLGADPYAKQINEDGELINIDIAGTGDGMSSKYKSIRAISEDMEGEEKDKFLEDLKSQFRKGESEHDLFKFGQMDAASLGDDEGEDDDNDDEQESEEEMSNLCQRLSDLIAEKASSLSKKRKEIIDEMAAACDCSTSTIYRILNGKNACPSEDMLGKLASVLLTNKTDLIQHAEKDGCDYSSSYSKQLEETNNKLKLENEKLQKAIADLTLKLSKADKNVEKQVLAKNALSQDLKKLQDRKTELIELTQQQSVSLNAYKEDKKEWNEKFEKYVTEKAKLELDLDKANEKLEQQSLQVSELQNTNKALTESNKQLVEEANLNKDLIESGKSYLDHLRAECIKLYKSTVNAPKDDVIELITNSKSEKQIEALLHSYGHKKANQFSFSCSKCNSKDFTFGSVQKQIQQKEDKQEYIDDSDSPSHQELYDLS